MLHTSEPVTTIILFYLYIANMIICTALHSLRFVPHDLFAFSLRWHLTAQSCLLHVKHIIS